MRQLLLFKEEKLNEFGGNLLRGKRKSRRPFDTNCIQHLVLKASEGDLLLENRQQILEIIHRYAIKHGVHVQDQAVNDDHIHLAVKFSHRSSYVRWIRAVTASLVRETPGVKWKFRPYTRNVGPGRSVTHLKNYFEGNRSEAEFVLRAKTAVEICRRSFEKIMARTLGE